MDTIVTHWVERSKYDLDTAKVMLDSGRYLYVAYMCQQTIEKILKAIIAQQGKENFPIHNLIRLKYAAQIFFSVLICENPRPKIMKMDVRFNVIGLIPR